MQFCVGGVRFSTEAVKFARQLSDFTTFSCGCIICSQYEKVYTNRLVQGKALKTHRSFYDDFDIAFYSMAKNGKTMEEILATPDTVTCPASITFINLDFEYVAIPVMMLKQTEFAKYLYPFPKSDLPTQIPLTSRQCAIFDYVITKMDYFGPSRQVIKIVYDSDVATLINFFGTIGRDYVVPFITVIDTVEPVISVELVDQRVIVEGVDLDEVELPSIEVYDALVNPLNPAERLISSILLKPPYGETWSTGLRGTVAYDEDSQQFSSFRRYHLTTNGSSDDLKVYERDKWTADVPID